VRNSAPTSNLTCCNVVLATMILLACPQRSPHAGEVYKSVDAEGNIVYSDRADASVPKSPVHVDQPKPQDVAQNAKEQAILKAEDDQRKRLQANDDAKKAEQDRIRQAQCDSARDHYYSLRDARRLYDRDADGNRVYINDADADAKREEARAAMAAACGS